MLTVIAFLIIAFGTPIVAASIWMTIGAHRSADRAERHEAKVRAAAEQREREDAERIEFLRQALDAANRRNNHFVEWASEKPVEAERPVRGGEPS